MSNDGCRTIHSTHLAHAHPPEEPEGKKEADPYRQADRDLVATLGPGKNFYQTDNLIFTTRNTLETRKQRLGEDNLSAEERLYLARAKGEKGMPEADVLMVSDASGASIPGPRFGQLAWFSKCSPETVAEVCASLTPWLNRRTEDGGHPRAETVGDDSIVIVHLQDFHPTALASFIERANAPRVYAEHKEDIDHLVFSIR